MFFLYFFVDVFPKVICFKNCLCKQGLCWVMLLANGQYDGSMIALQVYSRPLDLNIKLTCYQVNVHYFG